MAQVNAICSADQEILVKFMATKANDNVGDEVDNVKGPHTQSTSYHAST